MKNRKHFKLLALLASSSTYHIFQILQVYFSLNTDPLISYYRAFCLAERTLEHATSGLPSPEINQGLILDFNCNCLPCILCFSLISFLFLKHGTEAESCWPTQYLSIDRTVCLAFTQGMHRFKLVFGNGDFNQSLVEQLVTYLSLVLFCL